MEKLLKLLTKIQQAKKSPLRADYRYEMGLDILLQYYNDELFQHCCDHYDEEKHDRRERIEERIREYGLIK